MIKMKSGLCDRHPTVSSTPEKNSTGSENLMFFLQKYTKKVQEKQHGCFSSYEFIFSSIHHTPEEP